MKWVADNNLLKCPNQTMVKFDFDIEEIAEVGNVCVVVLRVPPDESMTENVFGVSEAGELLWQIERIPETSSNQVNCYTGVSTFKNNTVRIANWNDTVVDVEVTTGKVGGKYFGRFTCKCPPL